MSKKNQIPKWLPFGILASGMIAIGAGIRSGKLRQAATPTPPPPVGTKPPISTASFP